MKKHRIKHKTIWCDPGFLPYYYAFCPSKKAWNKEAKRLGIDLVDHPYPQNDATCTHLVNPADNKHISIVSIREDTKRSPRSVIELLVHEGMHVWRRMRKSVGERKPSSEFEAYSMQNIVSNLMTAYEHTRGPLTKSSASNRSFQKSRVWKSP